MFARLLILLASLSLLANLTSATNLRKDAVAVLANSAEIPIDHARAAKAYGDYMKGFAKRNAEDLKIADESIAAAHVNARKYVADLHKAGKLTEMKGKAAILGTDVHVRNGAYVTRRRPNADCSGMVSRISAKKISGNCESDGMGGSYYLSCSHEDGQGNVQMHASYFGEEGCMNDWWGDQVVHSDRKCQYYSYGENSDGPSMQAAQCTSNNMGIAIQSGGIAFAYFAESDSTCDGSPQTLHVERYGACRLVSSRDEPGYFYMTLDSCAPETGKTQLTIYTDSACLRPVARGMFNMGGPNGGPYGTCQPDEGAFAMTRCFPEGGM